MRTRGLFVAFFLLAGSGSAWSYASDANFNADNKACADKANASLPSDSVGRARDRAYNQAYGDCMKRRGYTEHAWVENHVPALTP